MSFESARENVLVQTFVAMASSRLTRRPAAQIAGERYGWTSTSVRALLASTTSAGGALVPIDSAVSEVIDALIPLCVVRRNVPKENIIPLPHGNMRIGRSNSVPSTAWIGEDAVTEIATLPAFGEVNLQAKKAIAIFPISNDLLRFSQPGIEDVVRDGLLKRYASAEDLAFLTGFGSQYAPKGLRWSATTVNDATQSYSVTTVLSDLTGLISALENANIAMRAPCWFTSPQVLDYLRSAVAAGSGNYMFPEIRRGELLGFPIETTTNIPANLGGSSNQSEIYLADMSEAIVGVSFLEVTVNPNATYHDDSGNHISAFDRDESVLKLTSGVDFALKQPQACAVLTNVPWAA